MGGVFPWYEKWEASATARREQEVKERAERRIRAQARVSSIQPTPEASCSESSSRGSSSARLPGVLWCREMDIMIRVEFESYFGGRCSETSTICSQRPKHHGCSLSIKSFSGLYTSASSSATEDPASHILPASTLSPRDDRAAKNTLCVARNPHIRTATTTLHKLRDSYDRATTTTLYHYSLQLTRATQSSRYKYSPQLPRDIRPSCRNFLFVLRNPHIRAAT
ncbi:hypothetical protein BKA61DRAFT_565731 [Leptodontidium sp. MPI-SDFR-AT-0119]|nr:hypothetical protein BKA61DRAFT_565731 [Leptodontidium sp. MPI-SDFR-AT-0119]